MLTDPQVITIDAVPNDLPRVSTGTNSSAYAFENGTIKLTVSHAYGKRNRRVARLEHSKIAADPLISAQNIKYTMFAYMVFDTPVTGYTNAEAAEVIAGLTAWLTADTGANVTKVLGGQN